MKRVISVFLIVFVLMSVSNLGVLALDTEKGKYRLGELVNTGKDNGYSKRYPIDKDDPHYSWMLGEFYVQGFTRHTFDENKNPIFLKNTGDNIELRFDLEQDINALNGDKKLYICDDKNGYEEKYGIEKSNLKKGTLIIQKTDSQNKKEKPQIHVNFLKAVATKKADTKVMLCEEGDYDVSLLYEIKNDNFLFFDSYYNYRIDFNFSVRNGNTMVFPFDAITGQELKNSVFTENGFYIDLANSKYLDINIKREVLNKGVDGLVEDTRYNRPAGNGEKFTEEGIYTITAINKYTNVKTEKKIYVGKNNLMKSHVVTGLSIKEIQSRLSDGKTIIDESGNLVKLNTNIGSDAESKTEDTDQSDNKPSFNKKTFLLIAVSGGMILFGIIVLTFYIRKKHIKETEQS